LAAATIIAGAGLALGAGTSIAGAIGANKSKKALNNYKRQDLTNAFEKMQISTAGSDLMREEAGRTVNGLTSAVSRGGARAITGNIGRIAATSNDANQRAAMEIDRQYQDRNRFIANENSRIQDMYENRENMDLAGLGAQMQANRETMWNGISGMQSSFNFGAQNGMFAKSGGGGTAAPNSKFQNGGYGSSLGATNTYSNSQIA